MFNNKYSHFYILMRIQINSQLIYGKKQKVTNLDARHDLFNEYCKKQTQLQSCVIKGTCRSLNLSTCLRNFFNVRVLRPSTIILLSSFTARVSDLECVFTDFYNTSQTHLESHRCSIIIYSTSANVQETCPDIM